MISSESAEVSLPEGQVLYSLKACALVDEVVEGFNGVESWEKTQKRAYGWKQEGGYFSSIISHPESKEESAGNSLGASEGIKRDAGEKNWFASGSD